MGTRKSTLVNQWKKFTLKCVKRRFGESISLKKVEAYLDHLIAKEMEVPKIYWVNNYRRAIMNTDMLAAFESIEENNFIMGGGATTYLQHGTIRNPLLKYILKQKGKRTSEKNTRDTYERGVDDEWDHYNTKQNNTKTVMNALYGVFGYAKFIFHNIFLAEAITRMGKVIIATAACGFENFLCDNMHFAVEGDLYEYVNLILDEYQEKYKDRFDFSILGVEITAEEVVERLILKCGFPVNTNTKVHLRAMINRLSRDELLILYYKNNFMVFNRIPVIQDKIVKIMKGIPELKLPDINKIEDPGIRDEVNDLWKFYDTFVFYNHPIYDNVRKMAYGTRKGVLYIDTDSNFISLSRWVHQIQHEFMNDSHEQDTKEFIFICANILTIFLSIVVKRNLQMFAENCNVSPDWQKYLSMKNELFFWKILFGDVKKRYIDLQMIQEGKLLKDGKGLPEIKGYDFRKFTTKASLREYYTNMCMERILSADDVNLRLILKDIDVIKRRVRASMEKGEAEFFKQANVSAPEHYADPLRISGIKGVMLWNAICPENAIELPSDVDLIPIRDLSTKRNREWLQETFPEIYDKIEREIWLNRNPNIAKMSLNVIAKPKNDNIEMPVWLLEIMDTAKIINSTVKLINPIMESLGMKIQRPTKNKEFFTNIVEL